LEVEKITRIDAKGRETNKRNRGGNVLVTVKKPVTAITD
jgi:hypothetical protein